jgi:PilZ domain-containing protein
MEHQTETSVKLDLLVRIWGMANGRPFFQNVHTQEINKRGAKLSGIDLHLSTGDVIGVQLGDKKARVKIVWVIEDEKTHNRSAGIEMLEGQPCPWEPELAKQEKPAAVAQPAPRGQDLRRFSRHKIPFPIEILQERNGSLMRTQATDISGRGCYVETLMPLPKGTELSISFWIESEKITTPAIVRASDGGVGMGIEFTGLSGDVQKRLQQVVEKMDPQSGSAINAKGAC